MAGEMQRDALAALKSPHLEPSMTIDLALRWKRRCAHRLPVVEGRNLVSNTLCSRRLRNCLRHLLDVVSEGRCVCVRVTPWAPAPPISGKFW